MRSCIWIEYYFDEFVGERFDDGIHLFSIGYCSCLGCKLWLGGELRVGSSVCGGCSGTATTWTFVPYHFTEIFRIFDLTNPRWRYSNDLSP